ncbi:MAG: hypothetical protein U5K38_01760 [Woeseiaceae bacterium]|nr:hypothetical protein [Woeseiaceae bacterium]
MDLLKGGRVGALLEFESAVHAEMDALLSAARASQKINGSRLFVRNVSLPLWCAHIVSAGVDEVQYIEPYPKSAALKLHSDAICVKWVDWKAPSAGGKHVRSLFSGVAPRMYRRAFQQSRELKDKTFGGLQYSRSKMGESVAPREIKAMSHW